MATHSNSIELRRGSRRQPEASRNAILQAALVEFAREGLAGARMDAIADAAGVNKALLYYYFRDKETLYRAILDTFFEPLVHRILSVCNRPGSAGERFLAYARAHFDAIAESQYYAHIFMSELMSASRGGSPLLDHIFERYMRPIGGLVLGLVQEGVKSGEFRPVDPNQFLPSVIGCIVHYFLTAPVRQKFMPGADFNSAEAIQQRRAAVLDFIAAALFADREKGVALAANTAATETAVARPAKRKHRARPPAAPLPLKPPTSPAFLCDHPEATGYVFGSRWFPDPETADAVLQAEQAQRERRKAKRLQAQQRYARRTPKEGGRRR
jgi:TetR/AcrR family transcriptional regulator